MNKKSFVFATFLALSTLLTSNAAFAQSVQTTTMPAPYQNYYEFNSDCNLGTRTLKVGSKGRYVRTLEGILNLDRGLRGLPDLIPDGNYNSVTKKAVADMQKNGVGITDLYNSGIVDTETREVFTDFCFQYVGRNVPRVIQNNDWSYNNRDQSFVEKFNNGNFSGFGINKIKTGQSYVFEGRGIPNTCNTRYQNCNTIGTVGREFSLGIRLESVTGSNYTTTCARTWYGVSTCPLVNNQTVDAKMYFVLIDDNGEIVKRVTKTLSLEKVYNYDQPVYETWGATTSNAYVPKSVTEVGDYRVILQQRYEESGVEINVQNISHQYPVVYN